MELARLATTPGEFNTWWTKRGPDCVYDPPQWVDLTAAPVDMQKAPPALTLSDLDEQISETDDNVICPLDGFTPSQHLGLSPEEVETMAAGEL